MKKIIIALLNYCALAIAVAEPETEGWTICSEPMFHGWRGTATYCGFREYEPGGSCTWEGAMPSACDLPKLYRTERVKTVYSEDFEERILGDWMLSQDSTYSYESAETYDEQCNGTRICTGYLRSSYSDMFGNHGREDYSAGSTCGQMEGGIASGKSRRPALRLMTVIMNLTWFGPITFN